jgi:sucrose-phosphate synthase
VLITAGLHNPLREPVKDEQVERTVLTPIREIVNEKNLWGKISAFCVPDQGALAATYRFMAQRRSVFALMSLFEPFGLAPLEATVAGLPVVGTKNGGLSESLRKRDNEYGVLVDPEDTADIVRGLERLLCNAQEWEHFAQSGQQHVLNCYTWEAAGNEYLNLIKEIVSSPTARRPAELLPIHSYFLNPQADTDVSLEELSRLYFGAIQN